MAMANYSIGDKVWYDKNQDWVQNADEPGYANVEVNLLNESGDILKSTQTEANGEYLFTNIPTGEYRVTVTPPQGANIVTEAPFELWLSENRHDINFGLFKPLAYSITGSIWNDQNRDWAMDNDEPKVPKVTVELYKDTGEKVATTTSDTKGQYKFNNITIGEYKIKVIENNKLSIVTESPIELWVSENRTGLDFGIFETIKYEISGSIWNDDNKDWVMNRSELKIDNVNVELYNDQGDKLSTTKTDNKGLYKFSNLLKGEYRVRVIPSNKLSIITESPIELWLSENRNKIDFGLFSTELMNPTITREQLVQMIQNKEDVSKVNTSEITDMSELFRDNATFNQDISNWDTSSVVSMEKMFQNTKNFNQSLNSWDTSNVKEMDSLFDGAEKFNQPLNSWDTSKVTSMKYMFTGASSFNQPLNNWNLSNTRSLKDTFAYATHFYQNISNWNVSKVINHSGIFNRCPVQTNINYQPKFK